MKLAEALAARADAQARLQELRSRIRDNARHQEGDAPAEDPNALIVEADRVAAELTRLVRAINATNAATPVEGIGTLTDAIAERDGLAARRKVLVDAAGEASGSGGLRLNALGAADGHGPRRPRPAPAHRRALPATPAARPAHPGRRLDDRARRVDGHQPASR